MTGKLRLEDDVETHQGCVRTANEDSLTARSRDQLWAVADGMGGHKNGKHASETVAKALASVPVPDDLDGACEALSEAIHTANDAIFVEYRETGEQMGSTVVALVIRDQMFAVLWAGDSRAYVLRDGQLHRLTRDHTQVQELLDRGLLTPEEAVNHPMSHVLARAVGVQEDLLIDAVSDAIQIGDIFLLCSDGLHGVLSDAEIAQFLERWGRQCAGRLIEACLERGAPDNVTVAIVEAFEPTTLVFADNREMM